MEKEQAWYHPVVESQEAIVLDDGERHPVIMDRAARVSAFVSAKTEPITLAELAQKQLTDLLAHADRQMDKTPLRFLVHTRLEALYRSSDVRKSLPKLLVGLLRRGSANLIIDFSRPPRDWFLFVHWVYRLLWEERELYGHVLLRGPFPQLSDEVKDAFQELGIRLGYTAGWRHGAGVGSSDVAEPDSLRDLARYGFRIPILFYVHAENLDRAAEVVDRGLRLNEHSGFALPAIFHHPEYDPATSPPPPSASAYAELLARLYHEFPDYDDIFQPIAELAELMSEGGWNAQNDVPAIVRLLLRPERGIMIFRQVPSQAVSWIDYADLRSMLPADIAPRLLEFHRKRFAWSKHAFCGRCQWRYVCGGSDSVLIRPHEAEEWARAACEYRILFLEEFARKKAESLPLRLPLLHHQTGGKEWMDGGLNLVLDFSAQSLNRSADSEPVENSD